MERLETMYMGLHVLISFEFWVKWYVYFQRYHIWYSGQYTYLNGDNAIGIGMHGAYVNNDFHQYMNLIMQ